MENEKYAGDAFFFVYKPINVSRTCLASSRFAGPQRLAASSASISGSPSRSVVARPLPEGGCRLGSFQTLIALELPSRGGPRGRETDACAVPESTPL